MSEEQKSNGSPYEQKFWKKQEFPLDVTAPGPSQQPGSSDDQLDHMHGVCCE
jgi:hypothetical protein